MIQKSIEESLKKAALAKEKIPFCEEYYEKIPLKGVTVALAPSNREKNFDNQWGLPFDHNLITSIDSYINASPMKIGKHRYIAAQGPREKSFDDFWNMVWQEKSSLIVAVTNEEETHSRGMIGRKFDRYWPEKEGVFGPFKVTVLEDLLIKSFVGGAEEKIRKRLFSISKGNETRVVTHLQLENWFDNDVVRPFVLKTFSEELDLHHNFETIIVHCAAGIGRTGTLIAYHSLYHEIQEAISSNLKEFQIDIPKRIQELRDLRWGAIVASPLQYDLLIETLALL